MPEQCKDGSDTNTYELRSRRISRSAGSKPAQLKRRRSAGSKSIPVQPAAQLKHSGSAGSKSIPVQPPAQVKHSGSGLRWIYPKSDLAIRWKYSQPDPNHRIPNPEDIPPFGRGAVLNCPTSDPAIRWKYGDPDPNHRIPNPEDIPPLEDEGIKKVSHIYANAALSYLRQQGHDFNLVLADYYQPAVVGGGVRIHHNFQAKRPNDPPELTETFFAQLFQPRGHLFQSGELTVECCVSLGRSDSLPRKRDKYGCAYCDIYTYHPKNGCDGIIWGRSI